jgi:Fe/S biogenesis protein NfuA
MVSVTEAAKKKFTEVIATEKKEGYGLRMIVRGGGTPSPEFALNFVGPDEIRDDDTEVDIGEFKVYMDAESARWLEGASVDFVETLDESGFKVDAPNAGPTRPTGPLAESVGKVLEEEINPAIASHGGMISLVAIEDGTAYLRFGGGCQGCGMVDVTLKQGVEKVLFEKVPEITKVMDVTDHAAGTNPYYQPAK